MFLSPLDLAILIALFFAAKRLTRFFIDNAESLGLIDVPNERSSHSQPKPRGGGVSFVVTFYCGVIIFNLMGILERDWGAK